MGARRRPCTSLPSGALAAWSVVALPGSAADVVATASGWRCQRRPGLAAALLPPRRAFIRHRAGGSDARPEVMSATFRVEVAPSRGRKQPQGNQGIEAPAEPW
jgi:hypothetical protein